MKITQSLSALVLGILGVSLSISAYAQGNKGGNKGGKTGNGQDTPADVYLYQDGTSFGLPGTPAIQGDGWLTDGTATLYPANNELSGTFSCAGAIITDQAQGYVRMFVPAGDAIDCPVPNRFLRIRSDYDLDQDGLCVIPYEGRRSAGSFARYYDCSAGPEPDGLEEVMVTMHLSEVLGPGNSTPVGFQIRVLDYGDGYVPDGQEDDTPGSYYDPVPADIQLIGSQERAYNIGLTNGAYVDADPGGDVDARVFYNTDGIVDICQVVWKNAHSKDCMPIVAGVDLGMTIAGKVDSTPREDAP